MKKLLLLLNILLVAQFTMAQKTRADRFFAKGDYINAAKYYEEDIEQKLQKESLENIIISYYNVFEYKKAARYLRLLTNGRFPAKDKTYDNDFNFKYSQVLSALGDYEESVKYYKLYKENIGKSLDEQKSIEVIEEFKLKTPDYEIKKVKFNSDASDFGAVKYGDSVYFTSDRIFIKDKKLLDKLFWKQYKWTHQPFLDVYAVKVDEKLDTIGYIKPLPKTINSELHEGNICFSADGKTAYISRSIVVKGLQKLLDRTSKEVHLYKMVKKDTTWSEPKELSFNRKGYSYQHPALSPDGKKLYFSSNQPGGKGSFDLYYVNILSDDTYSEPVNLGETINTANREHFPFIDKNGHLFFASNGHLGLGMLDNFVSELVGGKFTTPLNLGVPINSQYDDFNLNYYDDKNGFFASNRLKKSDDIYSAKQIGEIFIREYVNTFEVRDFETKEFVPNATVVLTDKKGKEVYNNTLSSNASFNVNLLAGRYNLKAKDSLYHDNSRTFNVIEEQDQKHVLFLKKLPPPPPPPPVDPIDVIIAEKKIDKKLKEEDPKKFELLVDDEGPAVVEKEGKLFFEVPPIYFDYDMWTIREDSKKVLDDLSKKLERYPDISIKISSYTDSRGTARYNQILSERRAEATRNYLALERFINARRLKFEGFGESQPIIPCEPGKCSDEEHQLNRRSEFEILDY